MATETDTLPLIRTKLYRPRITGDLVPRPWLLERSRAEAWRRIDLLSVPVDDPGVVTDFDDPQALGRAGD